MARGGGGGCRLNVSLSMHTLILKTKAASVREKKTVAVLDITDLPHLVSINMIYV